MKRIPSNIVGTSIIALAMSTLIVGLAWAGSSALRNPDASISASDTTVPSEDSVPNDDDIEIDPGSPLDNSELTQLVVALSEQVDELSGLVNDGLSDLDAAVKRIDALATGVDEAQKDATSALSQAKKATTAAESTATKVETLSTTVATLSTAITAIEAKLVKINDEGTYTGTITPAQLTRKLTALDLTGDWPLDRTSGDLEAAKLKGPTFGCSPSYGFNTFAAFDAWSRITCVRVPK